MTQKPELLQLQGISKTFSRGTLDAVAALDNVTIDVRAGDFVTVIGSNGAGKTSLLNVVAGIFHPDRGGVVLINGNNVTNLSEHRRARFIGRVYQDPQIGTAAKTTIGENMSLALLRGRSRGLRMAISRQRRNAFREALEPLGLGLENRLNSLAGTLSGGQRQALALVMATLSRPSLLLLDEHTATLDPKTAGTVLALSKMIAIPEDMATIMVTHNMEVALRYGNRLIMMHQGRIIVDLDAEQRRSLTVGDLVAAFELASGEHFADDNVLLSTAASPAKPGT